MLFILILNIHAKNHKKLASIDIINNLNNSKGTEYFFIVSAAELPIKIFPLNVNNNMTAIYFLQNRLELGIYKDGISPIILEKKNRIIWQRKIDKRLGRYYKWKTNFTALEWFLGFYGTKFSASSHIYLWQVDDKNKKHNFSSKFDKKNAVNFKIAKLIGVKNPYAFAFIASNNTSKKVEIPDFYSENSRLKVKFPDDSEFVYQPKKEPENIELATGKSKFVKFDIVKLLKESNEFSEEDFNYGISELIWEIKLGKGKVQKYTFKLLKTEKPLPKATKTWQGYQMPIDKVIK